MLRLQNFENSAQLKKGKISACEGRPCGLVRPILGCVVEQDVRKNTTIFREKRISFSKLDSGQVGGATDKESITSEFSGQEASTLAGLMKPGSSIRRNWRSKRLIRYYRLFRSVLI